MLFIDLFMYYSKYIIGVNSLRKLIILCLASLVILSACGKSKEPITDKVNKPNNKEDERLVNVEITVPGLLMEDKDQENYDELIADAKSEGVKEVIINDDGSFTYKMSKENHKEMLEKMKIELLETIDHIKNDQDFVSVSDIKFNKSLDKFTLVVNQELYKNSIDGFAALAVGVTAMYYQLFTGLSEDEVIVTIDIKDEDSEVVFESVVYPDALKEQ